MVLVLCWNVIDNSYTRTRHITRIHVFMGNIHWVSSILFTVFVHFCIHLYNTVRAASVNLMHIQLFIYNVTVYPLSNKINLNLSAYVVCLETSLLIDRVDDDGKYSLYLSLFLYFRFHFLCWRSVRGLWNWNFLLLSVLPESHCRFVHIYWRK